MFEFNDYFKAAMDTSHTLEQTPTHLLISTDSLEADKIESIFKSFHTSKKSGKNQYQQWWNPTKLQRGKLPEIWTVSNEHRYRTPHGSHTVAAGGGCHSQADEDYVLGRKTNPEVVHCRLYYIVSGIMVSL